MFEIGKEYKNEYERETEFASINTQEEEDNNSSKSIILMSVVMISTVSVMGYFGFNYKQNQPESVKHTAVMGVAYYSNGTDTETPTVNYTSKNEIEQGLDNIVNEVEVKEAIESIVSNYPIKKEVSDRVSKDISKELDGMVDSFYTQKAIPMKLGSMVDDFYTDSSDDKKRRVVIVKEGDTLANISKRFYGDYQLYQKIIAGNSQLDESTTLYIGQKLNIPY